MPIIVPCPNCQGQLRVADDLLGRKVRCPACSVTFDAPEPPPPTEAAPPRRDEPIPPRPSVPLAPDELIPTEKLNPWKHLNLELTAETKEEKPPLPRGAVELGADLVEEPSPGPETPRRPRLSDRHDDMWPCPTCGRMVHRDARRCYGCKTPLQAIQEEEHGGGAPVPLRRDCEPHRGGLILTLGLVSLAGLCVPLSIVAIVPAIMAWVMGATDLRKMRRGLMDPEGENATQTGWICGIIGTVVNGLLILSCATCMGLWTVGIAQVSKEREHQQFAPPQKAQWRAK